ncbi:hypothetical protein FRC07_001911 [Ceratobasidium sp. 392]|nr:hypothetical protein FRC07_001911 [Ceratobasidium sp. 392]
MGKEITIVIYKPSTQNTEEYVIIVNPEEYKKYKDGAFDVFHSSTGHQGKLGKASKQQLESTFGTSRDDEVVKQILEKGTAKSGSGFASNFGDTNIARGSGDISSRGGPGR